MRLERRREDARVRQRLDDEKDDVGEQEQLERTDVGLALARGMGQRQRAGAEQQIAEAAHDAAVEAADHLHQLRGDALQRKIERADRALAAVRAERRRRRRAAARAVPGRDRRGGRQSHLARRKRHHMKMQAQAMMASAAG
jgi:hypothetical protein